VRVLPKHPAFASEAELDLVALAADSDYVENTTVTG
jgi:hypothetical protein